MGGAPNTVDRARSFLAGEQVTFEVADALWQALERADELSLARLLLLKLRAESDCLIDGVPAASKTRDELCRKEAMLTSNDAELNAATRHDLALELLATRFDINDRKLDGDGETLGVAAGICKRKWNDLGQFADLKLAAELYERGAGADLGDDAYAHINAAFLDDLLAAAGNDPIKRRERAGDLRQRIVKDLPVRDTWWNAATRAEALFGLGRYDEAAGELKRVTKRAAPWQLQTTALQLAHLAQLRERRPFDKRDVLEFFEALLPAAKDAVRSVSVGKIGLALCGGGLRASFFHLGVLAFLAERNILRHVGVLSCVSGGSIVGACYWLALRARLQDPRPVVHDDYLLLVRDLIRDFETAVAGNLRGQVQPSVLGMIWGFLRGAKGAMDPETTARALERLFYLPRWQVAVRSICTIWCSRRPTTIRS
jgi:hypothetical protein